jgi:hypothetical protein
MIKRGVIIKLEKREAVVFNDLLEYEKIKRVEGMFEGQTVEYRPSQYENFYKKLKMFSGAAAVIVLIFTLYIWFATRAEPEIFAYVDLDINPSIEFSIDEKNSVIGLKPLNYDAQKIVRTLDKTRGKPINEAIQFVIMRLQTEGIIKKKENQIILICSSPEFQGLSHHEKRDNYKRLNKTMKLIEETLLKEKDSNLSIKTLSIDPEVRKSSLENKISMGRYALYESVNESGFKISLQKAKSASLDELVSYLTDSRYDFTNKAGSDAKETTALNEMLDNTMWPVSSVTPHQSPKNNQGKRDDKGKYSEDSTGSSVTDKDNSNSDKKYIDWSPKTEYDGQATGTKNTMQESPNSNVYTPAPATITPAATVLPTVMPQFTPYTTVISGSTVTTATTSGIQPVKATPKPTGMIPLTSPGMGREPPDDKSRHERNEDRHGKDPNRGTDPGKPPIWPNITPGAMPTMGPTMRPVITPDPLPTRLPSITPELPTWKPYMPSDGHKMPPPNTNGIIPKTTPGPIPGKKP